MVDKQELAELIDALELPWTFDNDSSEYYMGVLLRRYKAELPMIEMLIHNYPHGIGWKVCVNRVPVTIEKTRGDAFRTALKLYHEALKVHLGIND